MTALVEMGPFLFLIGQKLFLWGPSCFSIGLKYFCRVILPVDSRVDELDLRRFTFCCARREVLSVIVGSMCLLAVAPRGKFFCLEFVTRSCRSLFSCVCCMPCLSTRLLLSLLWIPQVDPEWIRRKEKCFAHLVGFSCP